MNCMRRMAISRSRQSETICPGDFIFKVKTFSLNPAPALDGSGPGPEKRYRKVAARIRTASAGHAKCFVTDDGLPVVLVMT